MKKYFVRPDLRCIATVGIMMALEIILHRLVSIQLPIIQLHFGFLPIAVIAIMYGPIYSSIAWAAADALGVIIFPFTGSLYFGFVISAFIMGAVLGLLLYRTEKFVFSTFIAVTIITLAVTLCLDTVWLMLLTGNGILALLPARLIKCAIMYPIQVFFIIGLKKIYDKLPMSLKPKSV